MKSIKRITVLMILFAIVACSHTAESVSTSYTLVTQDPAATTTPFQPDNPLDELLATQEEVTPTSAKSQTISIGFADSVPQYFHKNYIAGEGAQVIAESSLADYVLEQNNTCEKPAYFVLALAAPFPTVLDGVTLRQIESAWAQPQDVFNNKPLLMDLEIYQMLKNLWGEAADGAISIVESSEITDIAWANDQFAILPFHRLDGRWKVLEIDGKSVLNQELENGQLPLSFGFCWNVKDESNDMATILPEVLTNRDLSRLTSVTLTGVTALVRAIANKMEVNGITYPAENIRDLLLASDFTHLSNEVAFANDCPPPNPYQTDLRFCSSPEYIELLKYIDVDIIELTGNHIQDWGREPFVETLEIYDANGFAYYAGGVNLSAAKEPLLIEHNGNKIAFIGCNAVGPPGAWATDTSSGNVPCDDYTWITQAVDDLSAQGYLVIVTLQHNEFYGLVKTGPQMRDFNPLSAAGAVIVSGSQAHYPNPFGFEGTHFIHYGLGNLFFDQMDAYVADGIQREFVDTHFFYDGRYISTQIYTLYLEDFSQPRMMSAEERRIFLEEAFDASGW